MSITREKKRRKGSSFSGNVPYRKVYENGVLKNPITKDEPYLTTDETRRIRRERFRPFNNSKTLPNIVSKVGPTTFMRYVQRFQNINGKIVVHLQLR